ncbi:MAG: hypothetical protein GC146_04880 [Limimaricola sp.]|uniref:hypothetical protein n=1 Tax=Limimaricola sp. TaxID=2211665 RepID=UPI001DCB71C3|nr:hypothetical protein [Limimaricola sp.]MBI1416540.1 hypothetical protein [Limimaricola sp.]
MTAALRQFVVNLVLVAVLGLGGALGLAARGAPSTADLAVAEALAMGATAADFCGKNGQALIDRVMTQACAVDTGTDLPAAWVARPDLAPRALTVAATARAIPVRLPLALQPPPRAPPLTTL